MEDRSTRNHVEDLRGVGRLAVEATRGVTTLVEAMHQTIAGGPVILGRPLERAARLFTAPIYDGIRRVTQLVGARLDLALAQLSPLLGESTPGPEREAVLAVVNGVLGDYLSDTRNPLATPMQLRRAGRPLRLEREALRAALPNAGSKLLVLVHGSCMSDRSWTRLGHDHGAALARDLGYTAVYLQYNSGLHISTNGRTFAALLERLVAEWPAPLEDLVILAHSMGGLVARSACHFGELEGHRWRRELRRLICLGAPHLGAPLERGGNWVDVLLGVSRYSTPLARLGKIRSAGVTDMRYGNVLDEDWEERDRFAPGPPPAHHLALPEDVECYAIAATTAPGTGGKLRGDGLVPLGSALGRHPDPELALGFPEDHQWIGFGMGHLDLLSRPEVYATLRRWLSPPVDGCLPRHEW